MRQIPHPSSPQGYAPLALRFGVDEVLQAFNLRQVQAASFESASREFSRLRWSAEWKSGEGRKHRRDYGPARMQMQLDNVFLGE